MGFTVKINFDGVEHKMQTLANSARDLEKPLAIFGGYMKKKALRKYEAQAFAPLAEATVDRRIDHGMHSLERKLVRDVKKAQTRAGKGIADPIFAAQAGLRSRGVQNRMAVLGELQKRNAKMWTGRQSGLIAGGDLRTLSIKQMASLDTRTARAVEKAVGKPILGNLTRSLTVEVNAGSVTIASRTAQEWSEIHNVGGTAGHGAKIPQRETVVVEPADLEVLASILKDHLLVAFQEGAHGPGY